MTTQPIQPSIFPRWGRILIIGLVVVGLVLVGFFGWRAVRSYIRIHQTGLKPGVTDVEAIRGWMTIPYIARAYHVPEVYVFEKIGIPSHGNQHKSLSQLNREFVPGERGVILNKVKEAIRQYQAERPPTREIPHE